MNLHKDLLYVVRNSKVHGKGVFARKDIPKGTRIIEYVGNIVSSKEGDKIYEEQLKKSKKDGSGAVYIFQLNRKQDIDGDVPWNPAKYINHSCSPNCKYKIIDNHIWIMSLRNISKGEELNYDYGYDLEDYEDHPCRCNSNACLGYIIGKRYRNKFHEITKIKNKK